jgi:hypothetical protein
MQFHDVYTWPHIALFASWDELIQKLLAADLSAIHSLMVRENWRRAAELQQQWGEIIDGIEIGRAVPPTWQAALAALNVSRLMVDRR